MKNILILLFSILLFTGCEKTISLDYKSNPSKIVIEGNITNAAGPYFVKITRSVRLTDTGNYPTIDDAVVTISDNAGNSETLTPQGSGMYRATSLTGVEGRTYTLAVKTNGMEYTAQSTMPQRVPFDSIKVEQITLVGETEYNIIPVYRDPVAKGNNYRFMLWVNGKLINQHMIQNDEVRNGLVNTMRLEINDNDLTLKTGDQLAIQMQCIDKKVALYYTTLMLMADNGPGGGTTPNNPVGNISNGALGIFSAHIAEERTKILP